MIDNHWLALILANAAGALVGWTVRGAVGFRRQPQNQRLAFRICTQDVHGRREEIAVEAPDFEQAFTALHRIRNDQGLGR